MKDVSDCEKVASKVIKLKLPLVGHLNTFDLILPRRNLCDMEYIILV